MIDELAGLELTAREGLSVPPAVIGPSGRNHCFRGRIIPARGNKVSFLSLRQIRVSTTGSSGVLGLQCGLLARVFIHHVDGHFYELVIGWYVFVIEAEMLGQLGGAGSRDALE